MSNRELSGQLPATEFKKQIKTQLSSGNRLNCQTDPCPLVRGNNHTTVYLIFLEHPPNPTPTPQFPPFFIMGLKDDAYSAAYTARVLFLLGFVVVAKHSPVEW